MEEVDKEISEMKLSLNARARIVAESYLTAVSRHCIWFHLDCNKVTSSPQVQFLTWIDRFNGPPNPFVSISVLN